MIIKWGLIVLGFFSLAACGHFQKKADHQLAVGAKSDDEALKVIGGTNDELNQSPAQTENIPIEVNKQVHKWINYFQGKGRHFMETYLERSSRYLSLMKAELRREGLPDDLVYVSLIESGFSHKANSAAAAVGYWQFIRETGKNYGLKINSYIDERRDPVLSTQAAARYFKALHNLFGNWYLALAAYNTGENRVKKAVMKYYTRDFWELARRRRFPRETANYVPKFIAATLIAKNPENYGFKNLSYEPAFTHETIEIDQPISLQKLASGMSSVSYEELHHLNPMYRSYYVPVASGTKVQLRIPPGSKKTALAALEMSASAPPVIVASEINRYRIRRGDTLSVIARRFHTSVAHLRRLNGFTNRTLLRVGRSIRIPDRETTQVVVAQDMSGSSMKRQPAGQDIKYHIVGRKESLARIAQKYKTTVDDLRELNGLGHRGVLFVGQRLAVKTEKSRIHVVRRGETLSHIARHYGVQVRQIALANQLSSRSNIMIGSELVIPVPQ